MLAVAVAMAVAIELGSCVAARVGGSGSSMLLGSAVRCGAVRNYKGITASLVEYGLGW